MSSALTIKDALLKASLILKNQKEAAILLSHHLQKERLYLMTHEKEPLKNPSAYFRLVQRRENFEPIEYITCDVSFYDTHFYIAPGALIPRPETELLIDKAKEIIAVTRKMHIAEIGTGSGIIAVMLARLFDDVTITATDISEDALKIARINAKRFDVEDRITFVHTSYLDGIYENFDMIISNPPYIEEGVILEKPLSFEPQNALFGGREGDEMLKHIIDIAIKRKVRYLVCEMGYDQKSTLTQYMEHKDIADLDFYQDYSGFDRGFVAKMKE